MSREAGDLPAPGKLVTIDTPLLAASYDRLTLILNNLCSYAETGIGQAVAGSRRAQVSAGPQRRTQ